MMWGFDASKLTDSELEKALALPDEPSAPSPERPTEADVIQWMMYHLGRYPAQLRIYAVKTWGDDQLEVHMADGSVFQIGVNQVR